MFYLQITGTKFIVPQSLHVLLVPYSGNQQAYSLAAVYSGSSYTEIVGMAFTRYNVTIFSYE